jgi:hypothetical protein
MTELEYVMFKIVEKHLPWSDRIHSIYYFLPEYQYSILYGSRIDFAWPYLRMGIEVQGGTWSRGRSGHSSGTSLDRDYKKFNHLQSLGWICFQYSASMLKEQNHPEIIAFLRNQITERLKDGQSVLLRENLSKFAKEKQTH